MLPKIIRTKIWKYPFTTWPTKNKIYWFLHEYLSILPRLFVSFSAMEIHRLDQIQWIKMNYFLWRWKIIYSIVSIHWLLCAFGGTNRELNQPATIFFLHKSHTKNSRECCIERISLNFQRNGFFNARMKYRPHQCNAFDRNKQLLHVEYSHNRKKKQKQKKNIPCANIIEYNFIINI